MAASNNPLFRAGPDLHLAPDGQEAAQPAAALCLLTITGSEGHLAQLARYTQSIATLLNGEVHHVSFGQPSAADKVLIAPDGGEYELIVFGEPDRSLVQRLLGGTRERRLMSQVTTSLLVAHKPRWPLRRLLLILRADGSDESAVQWTARLARAAGAEVTLLPIVPAQPGFYRLGGTVQPRREVLLAANTETGRYLRHVTRVLTAAGLGPAMQLRAGEPESQIEQEIAAGDYDLVVVAAEPYGRLQRWLFGELVGPLLRQADRPVLVTRSPRLGEASR